MYLIFKKEENSLSLMETVICYILFPLVQMSNYEHEIDKIFVLHFLRWQMLYGDRRDRSQISSVLYTAASSVGGWNFLPKSCMHN